MKRIANAVLCLALYALPTGCALLRKGEPLHVRYFVPELDEPSARPATAGGSLATGEPLRLRLGRVTGGAELGQRIVLRRAGGEISFYENLRWTERPENFLRRDLSRALFEAGGIKRIVSGPGPTLEVELTAFEELSGAKHEARFRAVIVLHSEREEVLERTVTASAELHGDGPSALVEALGTALAQGVDAITNTTRAALTTAAPVPNPG